LVDDLKSFRDNIAAHHGVRDASVVVDGGKPFLLAIRTLVLVDAIHRMAKGKPFDLRSTMRTMRWQTAAIWAKGMDGQRSDTMLRQAG
jgi:hypothetical protein